MTSRISFSKILKEEFRHHLVSIFVVVLCFLGEVLLFYFDIQDLVRRRSDDLTYIKEALAAEGEPVIEAMIPVMILGVLLAAEYFSYLHSRRKTDFYLSLPIKRNQQFVMGILVSLGIFIVPCVIATGLEIAIGYATGHAGTAFLINMLWRTLCKVLCFSSMWTTMALSMIMTGNLTVAFLGLGAFCSYIPVFIRYLLPLYQEFFYETYVQPYRALEGAWYYFSPVSLATGLAGRYFNWTLSEHLSYMIGIVVFILLIGLLAYWLYLKRPAEAAGRAMAFEKANTPIRFAIVIPLALYFGYFLSEMSRNYGSKIWLVIGIILGVVLIHGIVESIFNFDLRKMFSKRKQMLLTMGICLGFVLVLQMNVNRFNTYIPEASEVEQVVFSVNNDNMYFYDVDLEKNDKAGVSGEHVVSVLKMVENAIALNGNIDSYNENEELSRLVVKYQMKNGRIKARQYNSFDTLNEENRASLDSVMATEEFKKDYYDLYDKELSMVEEMEYYNGYNSKKLLLTEDEREQLIDIYLKELSALTFTEMETVERVGAIRFVYRDEQREEYYIHSNFKETLEFLESVGVDVSSPLDDATIMSVEFYEEYFDGYTEEGILVQNQELLEELKSQFVLQRLYGGDHINSLRDTRYAHMEFMIDHRRDGMEIAVRKDVEEMLKNAAQ